MTVYKNITYDDRDTGHFKYQGNWFLTGNYNASSVSDSGTLSSTKDIEANVTFTFPVPANAFYYYAIPRCCGGFYAICVDCYPDAPNWIPIDAVNATDNGQNPPVVLFSYTFDKPGIHEIILKNQVDTRFNNNSQITLDRFELQVEDTEAVNTSASTAAPTPSTVSLTSGPKSPSSAPIIGGAVGGAVALCGLFLLGFCLFRRHSAKRQSRMAEINHARPQPYTAPTSTSDTRSEMIQSTLHSNTTFGLADATPYYSKGHVPTASYVTGTSGGSASQPSQSLTSSPSMTSSSLYQPLSLRRETDAGRILGNEETLPPEYEQVFNSEPTGRHNRPPSTALPETVSGTGFGDLDDLSSLGISPRRRKFR